MTAPSVDTTRAPRTIRWDGIAAGLGGASLTVLLASLVPGGGLPGWPAASLALIALGIRRRPGSAGLRAFAGISASIALAGALLEIAVLWAAALAIPR